jgi:hypothetical protein
LQQIADGAFDSALILLWGATILSTVKPKPAAPNDFREHPNYMNTGRQNLGPISNDQMNHHGSMAWTGWADRIPNQRWEVYRSVIERAKQHKIPFALGGGFATATHTGRFRDTKDMDLYTLEQHGPEFKSIIEGAGLHDIYDELPYPRDVLYRATNGETIVEIIWKMHNRHASVDRPWLTGWGEIEARGARFFVAPPEEMMWAKLYVFHRDRCDWTDVLNYVYFCGPGLDWKHLLGRLGPDAQLLSGLLGLFSWLSPTRAAALPEWLWEQCGVRRPDANLASRSEQSRAMLLESTDWFGVQRAAAP